MKHFFVTAFLCLALCVSAQSTKFLSVHYGFGEPAQIGLSYEHKKADSKKSYIANVGFGTMDYKAPGVNTTGAGFLVEMGGRQYQNADATGWYTGNAFSYGSIKYDENFVYGKFSGTYSYFSFFQPDLGYKIKVGKKFYIDPYIGTIWKIEVKGKGDIDNKNVNEWAFRAGLRLTLGL